MTIYPVILCGGSGTRLWPASRPSRPKQFIALTGRRSLFQETVARVAGVEGAASPIVVTGAGHVPDIESQLAAMGAEAVVIVEPEGRDSAPAIAAAAAWIARRDPAGVAVVVASDHHIPDASAFQASVGPAALAAQSGAIVAFGVEPFAPTTAYGYIEAGEPVAGAPGVRVLSRFVEKPDAERARAYVAAGYLWNSGNFVFGAQVLLDELKLHAPAIVEAVEAALDEAEATAGPVRLGPSFARAPKISIDYAVMEKTRHAAVAPVGFAWSDLGAWDAVWAAAEKDEFGVAAVGDVQLIDSENCLVRAPSGPLVVGLGLRDLAVVVEPDAILICDLKRSQSIKDVTVRLSSGRRAETDFAPGVREVEDSLDGVADELERWLHTAALPVWWTLGADHRAGGFVEDLDVRSGRPVSTRRRLRVQARQIFSYATAGALGWAGPWEDAVEHGLAFLSSHYLRPDGLYRGAIDASGGATDETALLYDQAFVLLALAAGAKALPDRGGALAEQAGRLLATLKATLAHAKGGFVEVSGPSPYQANPLMHLFEAVSAWVELGREDWAPVADEIVELCLSRFIDPRDGVLREFFADDWSPLPGEDGRIMEPGHQFEWAWLLHRWGVLRGHAGAAAAAPRLFERGLRGVDPERGVAVNEVVAGGPEDRVARLWPQAEWLKAALTFGSEHPDNPAASPLTAARGLQRYLATPVRGLWLDKLEAEGRFRLEPAPASSFYHIVGALAELAAAGRASRD